jgi:hypothetical protein
MFSHGNIYEVNVKQLMTLEDNFKGQLSCCLARVNQCTWDPERVELIFCSGGHVRNDVHLQFRGRGTMDRVRSRARSNTRPVRTRSNHNTGFLVDVRRVPTQQEMAHLVSMLTSSVWEYVGILVQGRGSYRLRYVIADEQGRVRPERAPKPDRASPSYDVDRLAQRLLPCAKKLFELVPRESPN